MSQFDGRKKNKRKKYTSAEISERQDFIISRIKSGLSKNDIVTSFTAKYNVVYYTALRWYENTCLKLASNNPTEKKIARSAIIEMYHAQITAAQADMVAIAQEIQYLSEAANRKRTIEDTLKERVAGRIDLESRKLEELKFELGNLNTLNYDSKANLIEQKSRVRDRMFRMMMELAKIQGLMNPEMTLLTAINTLLDNNLLPSALAEHLLNSLEKMESEVKSYKESRS